jgi:hypothetical protein
MRLSMAKSLKRGDVVRHWKTGAEIVLQFNAEHHDKLGLVLVTDASDGRRYVHTEIVGLPKRAAPRPKTQPAVIHRF